MFHPSWFLSKDDGMHDSLFRENQLLKNQIQELLLLEETGFFIELDSLLRAILKKALILCKADSSFFALPRQDPSSLDIRISNLILEEKMTRIREKFKEEYARWQESESELLTIEDFILLPLTRRHKLIGIMGLKLNSDAPENVCEILPVLARQAATSLESAILYERMFKRLLVLANVFILGKEIITNIEIGVLVDKFLSSARDGTLSEIAAIFLKKDSDETPYFFRAQTAAGAGTFTVPGGEFSPLIREVARDQKPVLLEKLEGSDFSESEAGKIQGVTIRDTIILPLKLQESFLGVIQVANKTGRDPYSPEDLDLLKILGSQIAFVIQNADLFRDLQKAYIDTLSVLTSSIDAKDSYTHGHSQRVTELSLGLGKLIPLAKEDLENLKIGGLLHDIGKIGIPEQILNKPGRLSDEEFNVIKSHPDLGVKILEKVEFLGKIVPMIKHHHERFDGRGYPNGLSGTSIPLPARIIAIADTFDAMTSHRPYRRAMEVKDALDEIRRCKGSQFDPDLADLFIDMIRTQPPAAVETP